MRRGVLRRAPKGFQRFAQGLTGGIGVQRVARRRISLERRFDLLILCGVVRADNVSSRRIRLAAYVTRLERVRESHPSGVQIPYPPPKEVPAL